MASITIRNLDPAIKDALRQRAAANGRSMEEEARIYFAELAAATDIPPAIAPADALVERASGIRQTLAGKRILLVIGGGIAAYKCLDLIRRLRERGTAVRCVMTAAAKQFITELAVGALTADRVFTDLFDRADEHDVGHIRLSREADLIVVAPATADLMAKMANGLANDLASTVLLATNRPVLIAPAMNPAMWNHAATRRNRKTLERDGIAFAGPGRGEMAESGEAGEGRMAEPLEIVAHIETMLDSSPKPLKGRRIVMTSGPTHEPIDPVRYIANRSSGKQGHAIAAALAALGCRVTLVTGPTRLTDPVGVDTIHIESARDMLAAVEAALPADIAVCAAAVADWRPAIEAGQKLKKQPGGALPPDIRLIENPDILRTISAPGPSRPALVVGFAAETEQVLDHARAKRARKGCDWIVANDVSTGTGTFGGDDNAVHLIDADGTDSWPAMTKQAVADRLARRIADHFAAPTTKDSA